MKNILFITFFLIFSFTSVADEYIKKSVPDKESIAKNHKKTLPSYMECFKKAQEAIAKEQSTIKEQIKNRDVPIEYESRHKIDINALNPKIKPKSIDVKSSLEIDMPKYITEKKQNNNQCNELYGISF